jgi:hypothetical protein
MAETAREAKCCLAPKVYPVRGVIRKLEAKTLGYSGWRTTGMYVVCGILLVAHPRAKGANLATRR